MYDYYWNGTLEKLEKISSRIVRGNHFQQKSMDEPGMVVSPARGQLNRDQPGMVANPASGQLSRENYLLVMSCPWILVGKMSCLYP